MRILLFAILCLFFTSCVPAAPAAAPIKHARGFNYNPNAKHPERVYKAAPIHATLPASYDLRSEISPIKDQGQCGSCWAFGTVAELESASFRSGTKSIYSEEYLVRCNSNRFTCAQGGDFSHPMHMAPYGGVLLSDYPYTATDGTCKGGLTYHEQLSSWAYLPVDSKYQASSVTDMKNAIYTYGVIGIAAAASSNWDSYTGGVYNKCMANPTPSAVNHIIALVGWQDDASVSGGGYWLLRNSWGTSWGENGYMRIPYANTNGAPCDEVGVEANYVVLSGSPTPPPGPTPTPSPTPVPPGPCTLPTASTGHPATMTSPAGRSIIMGIKGVQGNTYKWSANPPFDHNAVPTTAQINYKPNITKDLKITVTNSCGVATAHTVVQISAHKKGVKEKVVEIK